MHDAQGDKKALIQDLRDYQLSKLNTMNAGLFRRVGSVPGKESLKQQSE